MDLFVSLSNSFYLESSGVEQSSLGKSIFVKYHARFYENSGCRRFGLIFLVFCKGRDMIGADLLALGNGELDKLIFKRSAASVSTVLDGETVILDIETGLYSGLNEVGTLLWDVMETSVKFADMREAVVVDFAVSPEECSENILSFLKELADNKLIEVNVEVDT